MSSTEQIQETVNVSYVRFLTVNGRPVVSVRAEDGRRFESIRAEVIETMRALDGAKRLALVFRTRKARGFTDHYLDDAWPVSVETPAQVAPTAAPAAAPTAVEPLEWPGPDEDYELPEHVIEELERQRAERAVSA